MKTLIIAGREIRSFFVSPTAYIVLAGFLLLGGWFFFGLLSRFNALLALYAGLKSEAAGSLNLNEHVLAPLLHNLSIILLILSPMITMRAFPEEKKSGTYELLLTSPLSAGQIVLGKFLGCLFFLWVMVLLTAPYPAMLLVYGNPEAGVLVSGYLGLGLLGTVFVSVGLFTSSLTDNQIVAAATSFVILLFLYVLSWPAELASPPLREALRYLSLLERFNEMVKGILDSRDLLYFLSLIAFSLFLTHRSVASYRWK